ncbi:MAG: phosphodiester glycosidase family protein, partial [Erysipelotrichaceae bacterium]|nr:phosphodiester glycosidase family protein [Erysipelotrichaceae bacterium]
EDKVKEIADANTMESINEDSDDSAIQFVEYDDTGTYASVYEEQILKKKNPDDRYKIVEIEEDDYHGYIAVLYDPKGLSLAISKYSNGELVSDFAERTKALVATNAGPFRRDANNNTYPYNVVISKGEVYSTYTKKKTVIGMNADGILMLKSFSTAKQAVKAGYVWGVQFGPNLVVNGKKSSFKGNGGYGIQPRTAIGQRKDGIVLLVVIEGRGASGSSGISMPDLAELFVRYGCYNAANLDGGGSSVMVVKNKLMNNPAGWGYSGERYLYNALIYK